MLLDQLNYFSFLIPLFLMVLASSLFVLSYLKKASPSLFWFAVATSVSVCSQIIQTIIFPNDIFNWASISCSLFLLSIAFTTHAIYLRLNVQSNWKLIYSTIISASFLLLIIAFTLPNLDARLSIVAFAAIIICFNNIIDFLHSKTMHYLDYMLKISVFGIALLIAFRAICLIAFYDLSLWFIYQDLIWATTQLMILFYTIPVFAILCCVPVHDIHITANEEQNTDPLTGLLNDRALNARLERFLKQKTKDQHALVLFEVNNFAEIKDQQSKLMSDLVLKHVSKILTNNTRKFDQVARIGENKFQILLCDVDTENSISIAKRIRHQVENDTFIHNNLIEPLNISIGISYCHGLATYPTSFELANFLLYQAKKFGKNNIQWEALHSSEEKYFSHSS